MLPSGILNGDVQQREQHGQRRLELAVEGKDFSGDLFANLALIVTLLDVEIGLEHFDEWEVAGCLAVRHRMTFEHEPPHGTGRVHELPIEPRLSDAGLTDDGHDLATTVLRLRAHTIQEREFVLATYEAGEGAARQSIAGRLGAGHPIGGELLGGGEWRELEPALEEGRGRGRGDDRSGLDLRRQALEQSPGGVERLHV